MYGVRTSVVYDFDGVADRLGPSLIGFEERPGTFAAMRESPQVHLVKTHRPRDELILDGDKAICLVRDGRGLPGLLGAPADRGRRPVLCR